MGADWERQLGTISVLERLSQREIYAGFRYSLRKTRSHVCRPEKRFEFLPVWRPAADRREETRFPGSFLGDRQHLGAECDSGSRGQARTRVWFWAFNRCPRRSKCSAQL